jgi:hypothetical protein
VKVSNRVILSYNYDLRVFNKSIQLIQNPQLSATWPQTRDSMIRKFHNKKKQKSLLAALLPVRVNKGHSNFIIANILCLGHTKNEHDWGCLETKSVSCFPTLLTLDTCPPSTHLTNREHTHREHEYIRGNWREEGSDVQVIDLLRRRSVGSQCSFFSDRYFESVFLFE